MFCRERKRNEVVLTCLLASLPGRQRGLAYAYRGRFNLFFVCEAFSTEVIRLLFCTSLRDITLPLTDSTATSSQGCENCLMFFDVFLTLSPLGLLFSSSLCTLESQLEKVSSDSSDDFFTTSAPSASLLFSGVALFSLASSRLRFHFLRLSRNLYCQLLLLTRA